MIRKYSMAKDADRKIALNFRVKEFACKDGTDEVLIDDDVLRIIQLMRTDLKKPLHIISGYRTKNYNDKIGGAVNSYHIKGQAVDIEVYGIDKIELALLAVRCGANGVIVYDKYDYIHIDTRTFHYLRHNKN